MKKEKIDTRRLIFFRQPTLEEIKVVLRPYMDWFDYGSTNWEEVMVPIFDHNFPMPVIKGGHKSRGDHDERKGTRYGYQRQGRRLEQDWLMEEVASPDMRPFWERTFEPWDEESAEYMHTCSTDVLSVGHISIRSAWIPAELWYIPKRSIYQVG